MMDIALFIIGAWIAILLTCRLLFTFIRYAIKEELNERDQQNKQLKEMYEEVKKEKEREWNRRN